MNIQPIIRQTVTTLGIILLFAVAVPLSVSADNDGVYSMFDRDLDGYVDREEFKQLVKQRRIKPAYKHLWIFDSIDLNRDEKISEREMLEVLQKETKLRSALRRSKP